MEDNMRPAVVLVLIGMLAACAGGNVAAQALPAKQAEVQSYVATPGQRFELDLDSRDGAFSVWKHLDISAMWAAMGELEVGRLGRHDRWAPSFTIRLANEVESAGLSLRARNGQPPLTLVRFSIASGALVEESVVPGSVQLNDRLPILLFWTDHSFSIQIGANAPQGFLLSRPPKRLILSSSTGELMVHDLMLGHSRKLATANILRRPAHRFRTLAQYRA
jgi:hypothetical protein